MESVTEDRILIGFLVVIAAGASFGLTIVLFGFVALAGLLLALVAFGMLCFPSTRRVGSGVLIAAAIVVSGPLLYVTLALL